MKLIYHFKPTFSGVGFFCRMIKEGVVVKKLVAVAVTLASVFCMTVTTVVKASADELEKGLERELRESKSIVALAAEKLRTGNAGEEIARLKTIAEDIRSSHLLM